MDRWKEVVVHFLLVLFNIWCMFEAPPSLSLSTPPRIHVCRVCWFLDIAIKPSNLIPIVDERTESTCGGCFNHHSWRENPQFHLRAEGRVSIRVQQHEKEGGKVHAIGFYVLRGKVWMGCDGTCFAAWWAYSGNLFLYFSPFPIGTHYRHFQGGLRRESCFYWEFGSWLGMLEK